jgi:cell division protein ZapA (FtsZ GTPase activity inhibitor)
MAKKVRVKISTNPEELLKLAELVAKKHRELGSKSPLTALDWDIQADNVGKALELHRQAKEYERLAEQAHEQRNALVTPLDDLLKQTRDLLKALYRAEPRKLGEFGFEVDDTPRKKKTTE